MSTNFYVTVADTGEELHFGKSSMGWVFAVRVHPEQGLNTLYDWMALLASPFNTVRNEYGCEVTVQELLNTVMNREWQMRGDADGIRKWHGEGSWDYNNYEFC